MQAEGILLAFQAVFISMNILWFTNNYSCWSYMTAWPGLLPLQLVTAAVTWDQCWLFMPKARDEDPIIQVCLVLVIAWGAGKLACMGFAWVVERLARSLAEHGQTPTCDH